MTQSIDVTEAAIPGTIRDAATGATLHINADGSINGVGATGPQGPIGPGGPAIPAPTLAGGTLAVTAAMSNSTILLNTASGSTCTLPAATGSGAQYRFAVTAPVASNSDIIKVHTHGEIIKGFVIQVLYSTGVPNVQVSDDSTDDTITLDGNHTGGNAVGEYLLLTDIASGVWMSFGVLFGKTSVGSPYSQTV